LFGGENQWHSGSHHQKMFGIWLWKGQILTSDPTGSPPLTIAPSTAKFDLIQCHSRVLDYPFPAKEKQQDVWGEWLGSKSAHNLQTIHFGTLQT
jgi:hypothetical protein